MGQKDHRCNRCGKRLKDELSIELGFGPDCYQKHLEELKHKNRLFEVGDDMGKANRIKKKKTSAQQNFNKEEKEVISSVLAQTVNNYTAAMLFACREELNFGSKRAKRFANKVMEIFDDITAGYITLKDVNQVVLDELGIDVQRRAK